MFCGHSRKQDIRNVIVGTQKKKFNCYIWKQKYIVIIEFKARSVLFFLISASYIHATELVFSILFLKIYLRTRSTEEEISFIHHQFS